MSKAFLTAYDVASLLKLKIDTVYSLAKQKKIPCTKVGGQWRFMESHVIQWFETRVLESKPNASKTATHGT